MKRELVLLMVYLFITIGFVTAQTSVVSGVVISEEDGGPITGASVLVEGTTLGAVTDIDGKFSIANVPSSAKTLQISFIGMQSQKVAIKPGTIRVVLKPDTEVLDEVMVVAYGTAKKSSFTESAAQVKNEKIEAHVTSNVTSALAGSIRVYNICQPTVTLPTTALRSASVVSVVCRPATPRSTL